MKHNYFKQMLMAVVAMFGFATTSVAWDVTVNVVDTDGKPADDVYVSALTPSGDSKGREQPEDGVLTLSLEEGQYVIIVSPDWHRDEYSFAAKTIDLNQDMTLSFTVPKKISFSVTIDGKSAVEYFGGTESFDYKDTAIHFYSSDYRLFRSISFVDGKFVGRFIPDESFRISAGLFESEEYDDNGFVKGTTKITDGATIRIGTFNVQSEGEGLTFPREEFAGNSSYKVFVGNPVRLAAVPLGDSEFVSWNINGKEYTDPMIDFTVKDDVTTATAKFSGDIHNFVKAADSSIDRIEVRVDGNYLVLPASVEASASIYAADGHLAKRTGVVGDRMNISDLPAGAYILSLNCLGKLQNAKFLKP